MKSLQRRILSLAIAVLLGMIFGPFSSALAVPVAGGTLNPTNVPKYVTPLVIPPVMPTATTKIGQPGTEDYDIAVRQFQQQILPGGIWNVATGVPGGTLTYPPTTVWSDGSALDPMPDSSGTLGGGLGVAPAPNSSFNYPAFTVENTSGVMTKVRWLNELVQDPVACFYGTPNGTSCNYLPHLLPVDQTLHWANPGNADCIPHGGMTNPNRTDCETLNQLPYMGPVPIVTHVHGAHVNPESDGYPEAWWLPNADDIPGIYATSGTRYGEWTNDGANSVGGSAFFAYENSQEATTIWYHDHSMGMTRLNVYAGPAGFWLIRGGAHGDDMVDDSSKPGSNDGVLPGPAPVAGDQVLGLNVEGDPLRNAIREIPVVIQDRSFDWVNDAGEPVPEGDSSAVATKLWYPTSRVDFDGYDGPYLGDPTNGDADISKIWNPEAFFNTMVVNGVTWPRFKVAQERYRIRLLNGCNSRTLNLAMFQVTAGTDGIFGTPDDILGTEIPFYQIGGDQGFLPKVVKIQTGEMTPLPGDGSIPAPLAQADPNQALLMMPAERADVIIDFTGILDGTHIRIINTAGDAPFGGLDPTAVADADTTGQVMDFVVDASINTGADPSTLVANLVLPPDVPLGAADNTRKLSLNEMISDTTCVAVDTGTGDFVQYLYTQPAGSFDMNACIAAGQAAGPGLTGDLAGPRQALLGDVVPDPVITNGWVAQTVRWADPIATKPILGNTEIWEIYNTTADAHPIHVHLVRFEIVNREAINIDANGVMTHTGNITTPLDNELGFKDTVVAYPGQVTRLKAIFDIPGLYVWHCHIVEHEDNEMMLPFEVQAQVAAPATITVPGSSPTGDYTVSWDASTTPGATYTLQESTDQTFATNVVETLNAVSPVSVTGKTNGTYYYRVKAVNPPMLDSGWTTGGNGCVVASVVTGSISINNGAATTTSPSVTLTLSGSTTGGSVTEMQFSKDGGTTWYAWEPYATSRNVTLAPVGLGVKSVSVRYKDSLGGVSSVYTDTITLEAAPTGTIQINGGATVTTSTAVTLTLSATSAVGTVTQMQFSKDGGVTWYGWEPYATSRNVTLAPAGFGVKSVSVRYKDSLGGVSSVYTDTITLEAAPTGTIQINGGATVTTSTAVTLTLSATSGAGTVTQMQFSKDGGVTWYGWEAYSTTRNVTLSPSGIGTKTVSVRYKDSLGGISSVFTDSIDLAAPPVGTVLINGGAATTTTTAATLSLSATSGVGTVTQMQFSKDGGASWYGWEPYQTSKNVTLTPPGPGTKTVSVRFMDSLGGVSSVAQDSIQLQ